MTENPRTFGTQLIVEKPVARLLWLVFQPRPVDDEKILKTVVVVVEESRPGGHGLKDVILFWATGDV